MKVSRVISVVGTVLAAFSRFVGASESDEYVRMLQEEAEPEEGSYSMGDGAYYGGGYYGKSAKAAGGGYGYGPGYPAYPSYSSKSSKAGSSGGSAKAMKAGTCSIEDMAGLFAVPHYRFVEPPPDCVQTKSLTVCTSSGPPVYDGTETYGAMSFRRPSSGPIVNGTRRELGRYHSGYPGHQGGGGYYGGYHPSYGSKSSKAGYGGSPGSPSYGSKSSKAGYGGYMQYMGPRGVMEVDTCFTKCAEPVRRRLDSNEREDSETPEDAAQRELHPGSHGPEGCTYYFQYRQLVATQSGFARGGVVPFTIAPIYTNYGGGDPEVPCGAGGIICRDGCRRRLGHGGPRDCHLCREPHQGPDYCDDIRKLFDSTEKDQAGETPTSAHQDKDQGRRDLGHAGSGIDFNFLNRGYAGEYDCSTGEMFVGAFGIGNAAGFSSSRPARRIDMGPMPPMAPHRRELGGHEDPYICLPPEYTPPGYMPPGMSQGYPPYYY